MMQQILCVNLEDARELECGHVIDPDLFADGDFGACPICQFAGTEAFSAAPARHAFQGGARPLRVLGDGEAERLGAELVGRPASLSADERAFALSQRGRAIAPRPASAPLHREAWLLVLLLCGEEAARARLTGATDVLRVAVLLSDPAADLSLAAPARFRIRRGDRGCLLRILDGAGDLEEAMLRRRQRWLRLGMVAWKALGARAAGTAGGDPEGPGQPRDGDRGQARADRRGDAGARAALETGSGRRLASLPPLGRMWLDPALGDLVVPFGRRGDSAGLGSMTKGSRIPVGPFPVVRLFAHWTGQVAVDLSAPLLDAGMRPAGHVSWTRLARGSGSGLPMVVHSGDVQNAPAGASEIIGVDLAALEKAGVAYVGTSAISFRGEKFGSFPCFAGWMGRDAQRSGEVFEPASVRARLDVASGGTGHLPLVLDVRRRAVVAADLAYGRGRGRNIEGDGAFRARSRPRCRSRSGA